MYLLISTNENYWTIDVCSSTPNENQLSICFSLGQISIIVWFGAPIQVLKSRLMSRNSKSAMWCTNDLYKLGILHKIIPHTAWVGHIYPYIFCSQGTGLSPLIQGYPQFLNQHWCKYWWAFKSPASSHPYLGEFTDWEEWFGTKGVDLQKGSPLKLCPFNNMCRKGITLMLAGFKFTEYVPPTPFLALVANEIGNWGEWPERGLLLVSFPSNWYSSKQKNSWKCVCKYQNFNTPQLLPMYSHQSGAFGALSIHKDKENSLHQFPSITYPSLGISLLPSLTQKSGEMGKARTGVHHNSSKMWPFWNEPFKQRSPKKTWSIYISSHSHPPNDGNHLMGCHPNTYK